MLPRATARPHTGAMEEIEPVDTAAEPGVEYPALCLRKGEDARLRAGHLWVFSNEVVRRKSTVRFVARVAAHVRIIAPWLTTAIVR